MLSFTLRVSGQSAANRRLASQPVSAQAVRRDTQAECIRTDIIRKRGDPMARLNTLIWYQAYSESDSLERRIGDLHVPDSEEVEWCRKILGSVTRRAFHAKRKCKAMRTQWVAPIPYRIEGSPFLSYPSACIVHAFSFKAP